MAQRLDAGLIGDAVVLRDVTRGEMFGEGKGWSNPNPEEIAIRAGQKVRVLQVDIKSPTGLTHYVRFVETTPPFLKKNIGGWWLRADTIGYLPTGKK